jgi:hypothetical protein
MNPCQRIGRHHRLKHLDGIVLHDAKVAELALFDALKQGAYAGFMDLDAQEVRVRTRLRYIGRGLTHAEADFHHQRRGPAEHGVRVQGAVLERDQVARAERLQRALLARAHAARPQHVAAHRAARGGRRRGSARGAHCLKAAPFDEHGAVGR